MRSRCCHSALEIGNECNTSGIDDICYYYDMNERNSSNATIDKREPLPGGVTGKGFVKGDPRINTKGRPVAFDVLRATAQALLAEPARDKKGIAIIGPDGHTLTNLDVLLRRWIASEDPRLQVHVVEIAYGKVPNPVMLSDKDGNSQGVTMIEVVKDRGDGSTETLRAMTSAPALAADLHAHLDASIRQADAIDDAVAPTVAQDV